MNKSLIPLLIVLCMLFWLLEGNFHLKFQQLRNKNFLLAIALYVVHVTAMLYTQNLKAGWFDLEQKLALVILPLLFFFTVNPDNELRLKVLKSFITGCVLAGLICFSNACYKFYLSGEIERFLYTQLSPIMHTSYFAMYLCFAIILLLFKKDIIKSQLLKLLAVVFFMLLIVLSSSKSGLFSLGLILLIKFSYDLLINKSYVRALLLFTLVFGGILTINFGFPKAFQRLREMKQSIESSGNEVNSNTSRMVIWELSSRIISANYLFGVGTGDVKDVLKKEYDRQQLTELSDKKLNAHNQYLQTFMALGLLGILSLLCLLGVILYLTWTRNMLDGTLLTVIIAFNMLFESMLETQAGVVFIAFFLMYYYSISSTTARNYNPDSIS